jgi:hypothetical protein
MDINGELQSIGAPGVSGDFLIPGDLQVQGVVKLADGTDAAPSLTYIAEETTGFTRSGTDEVSYVTQGAKRVRLGNHGITLPVSLYTGLPQIQFDEAQPAQAGIWYDGADIGLFVGGIVPSTISDSKYNVYVDTTFDHAVLMTSSLVAGGTIVSSLDSLGDIYGETDLKIDGDGHIVGNLVVDGDVTSKAYEFAADRITTPINVSSGGGGTPASINNVLQTQNFGYTVGTVSTTTSFLAPTSGWYTVTCFGEFPGSATGSRSVELVFNAVQKAKSEIQNAGAASFVSCTCSGQGRLAAGQAITANLWQNSGGAMNMVSFKIQISMSHK